MTNKFLIGIVAAIAALAIPLNANADVVNFQGASSYSNGNNAGNTAGGGLYGATFAQGVFFPDNNDTVFFETRGYLTSSDDTVTDPTDSRNSYHFNFFNREEIDILAGEVVAFRRRFDQEQSDSILNIYGELNLTRSQDFTLRQGSVTNVETGGSLLVEALFTRGSSNGANSINVNGGSGRVNNLSLLDSDLTVNVDSGDFTIGNLNVGNDTLILNLGFGAEIRELSNIGGFDDLTSFIAFDSNLYELNSTTQGDVTTYFLTNTIPEPGLTGLGILGLAGLVIRRRR